MAHLRRWPGIRGASWSSAKRKRCPPSRRPCQTAPCWPRLHWASWSAATLMRRTIASSVICCRIARPPSKICCYASMRWGWAPAGWAFTRGKTVSKCSGKFFNCPHRLSPSPALPSAIPPRKRSRAPGSTPSTCIGKSGDAEARIPRRKQSSLMRHYAAPNRANPTEYGKRCFPLRRVIDQRHNHVDAASLGLAICDCKERPVCLN